MISSSSYRGLQIGFVGIYEALSLVCVIGCAHAIGVLQIGWVDIVIYNCVSVGLCPPCFQCSLQSLAHASIFSTVSMFPRSLCYSPLSSRPSLLQRSHIFSLLSHGSHTRPCDFLHILPLLSSCPPIRSLFSGTLPLATLVFLFPPPATTTGQDIQVFTRLQQHFHVFQDPQIPQPHPDVCSPCEYPWRVSGRRCVFSYQLRDLLPGLCWCFSFDLWQPYG